MANSFVFKETKTTSMKIAGFVDTDNMTVDVDGDLKELKTLLSPFNGGCVEIKVTVKDENELDMPEKADE